MPPANRTGDQFDTLVVVRHKPVLEDSLKPSRLCRVSGRNGGQSKAAHRPSPRCIFQATGTTANKPEMNRPKMQKPPRQCRGGFFASSEAFASHGFLIVKRFPSLAGLAATYSSKS